MAKKKAKKKTTKKKATKKTPAKGKADKVDKEARKAILKAVKEDGSALEHADKIFKADREIVLAAVKQDGEALEYADKSLKSDRDFMLKVLKQDELGWSFQFADKTLKADREVVLAAVKKNGWAFQFAAKSLKDDREFMLKVVQIKGAALEYAGKNLKADREVVLKAVKQDESAIEYAGKNMLSDKHFIKNNIMDKSILKKYLKNDKNSKHLYEIEIRGEGGKQIANEISKMVYEYFCKDNDLLIDHICLGKEVPDKFHIGDWYDCGNVYETGDCFELGYCTMSIDGNGESHNINMNEKKLKKLGVTLIREKQTIEDSVKPGEIKYFLLGMQKQEGTMNYEIELEGSFTPKKLSLTVSHFDSREMITFLEYDGQVIENGIGDYSHEFIFEVIKVDKTRSKK